MGSGAMASPAEPVPVSLPPGPTPVPLPAEPTPVSLPADDLTVLDTRRWAWAGIGRAEKSPQVEEPAHPGDRSGVSAGRHAGQTEASLSGVTPLWITGTGWGANDRALLRRVLNGRYDIHARLVTHTLAEEPGLRAAGPQRTWSPSLCHADGNELVTIPMRGSPDRFAWLGEDEANRIRNPRSWLTGLRLYAVGDPLVKDLDVGVLPALLGNSCDPACPLGPSALPARP